MKDASALLRFLIVGAGIFLLDTGVFLLLFVLGVPPLVANAMGMLAGFVCGLFAHHHLSFRAATPLNVAIALRYGGSFLINLAIGSVVLQLGLSLALLPVLAKVLATAVVTLSNFLLCRYWVFSNSQEK